MLTYLKSLVALLHQNQILANETFRGREAVAMY